MDLVKALGPRLSGLYCVVHCLKVKRRGGRGQKNPADGYIYPYLYIITMLLRCYYGACSFYITFCRFLHMSEIWGEAMQEDLEKALQDHIIEGRQAPLQTNCVDHLQENLPTQKLKEQLEILCSLPNFHFWNYVRVPGSSDRSCPTEKPRVRFSAHLLHSPDEVENEEGFTVAKHVPTSPRNRVMYYLCFGETQSKMVTDTLVALYNSDIGDQPLTNFDEEPSTDEGPPPKKKKKRQAAARVLKISRAQLASELHAGEFPLHVAGERKLFSTFREQLVMDGVLQWRLHEEDRDIVVLSDYEPTTGNMVPSSYVHVSSTKGDDGCLLMRCNCSTYSIIQKAALKHSNLAPGDDDVLEQSMTCMHCRFFKEHLTDLWDQVGDGGERHTLIEKKVFAGILVMDQPVVLIGDALAHGTTKLSVRGDLAVFSFLHLNLRQGTCWVRCTSGVCSSQAQNRKKVAKMLSLLKDTTKLCTHLRTLSENFEFVKEKVLPEIFFAEPSQDADADEVNPQGAFVVPNLEDAHLQGQLGQLDDGIISNDSGLWTYPALSSKHKPHQMDDPTLIRYVSS